MITAKNETVIQPYLFFDGRCEEALDFYAKNLGAQVDCLARFKESPDPQMCMPGIDPNKVMHATFRIGNNVLMASDGRCTGKANFEGFSLSLTLTDEAEADRVRRPSEPAVLPGVPRGNRRRSLRRPDI